jgi:D-alanyl-lipoteichoic acid acyltransferase DltB (MBOAT superfamily)
MLFNSNAFVFVFLPVVLAAFFGLRRALGARAALAFLLTASLFFYGWWNPAYVFLIAVSIAVNFSVARTIERTTGVRARGWLLAGGVGFDLGLLGYFKYANFFVANVETLTGRSFGWIEVALPIAISFFTFQQIAYLVDTWRGQRSGGRLLDYAVFVSFFPQLIAGPIVHHRELLPQLGDERRLRLSRANLSVGLTIFVVGLFKKTVIADTMAGFSTPVFAAAEGDAALIFIDAWGAALAYAFQIYFDFSGYSDMAIGLARMFGLRLPINFESPYKAASIVDFWRRWHITLSRFLRDYLYIPLGGNRLGTGRRYANLWLTMLLGGLWHGAGWNFLLWGGLHGSYLVVNHLWRAVRGASGAAPQPGVRALCVGLTFAVTVVAWVPFRAETGHGSQRMLAAMFAPAALGAGEDIARWTGFRKHPDGPDAELRVPVGDLERSDWRFWILEPFDLELGGAWWIALCMVIVWGLPNTRQWMGPYDPGLATYPAPPSRWAEPDGPRLGRWRPAPGWALFGSLLAFAAVVAIQGRLSEFIYFQF